MLVERDLSVDVITAAKRRIQNVFANKTKRVYLSFSGGKDSLCLAHLVLSLRDCLDLSRLVVQFVDEEAIFPCVENIVRQWREKFFNAGAGFQWFCLEVKHFSCLNLLESDDNFFCWDRYKQSVWVRQPPPFAIRSHPLLKPRRDSYQQFLARLNDGQNMTGVRIYESIQRRRNFTIVQRKRETNLKRYNLTQPIYDWHDTDVWLYLHEHHIEIPDAYLYMWQCGASKLRLRISQFFSVDTIGFLAQMAQFYPDLMERVCRREPNAYLVSLYYDSEMFRRRTRRRRELEGQSAVDYKTALLKLLEDIPRNFHTKSSRTIAHQYHRAVLKLGHALQQEDYRRMYEAVIAGDPKRRTLRAIDHHVRMNYARAALGSER